jgi:hypothetical protein
MWGKNAGEPYWTGPDLPDHQIYVASNLWQGYVSTAVDDVFPVDDGGVHYFSLEAAGIEIAVGSGLAVDALLGVDDADHALDEAAQRDFLALGHSPARDTFYEMRIPFAALGLDAAGFAAIGLGVMIGQGEGSCLDTLPHDPATHDTPGTSPSNSPLEWGDVDTFTVPFARVATAPGEPVIPNLDAGPPPHPTGDAGPAADVGGATGEPDAAPRPDPNATRRRGPSVAMIGAHRPRRPGRRAARPAPSPPPRMRGAPCAARTRRRMRALRARRARRAAAGARSRPRTRKRPNGGPRRSGPASPSRSPSPPPGTRGVAGGGAVPRRTNLDSLPRPGAIGAMTSASHDVPGSPLPRRPAPPRARSPEHLARPRGTPASRARDGLYRFRPDLDVTAHRQPAARDEPHAPAARRAPAHRGRRRAAPVSSAIRRARPRSARC